MTHTYNIAGMTCNGCVANVKSELLKLGNVLSADIQLTSPQATVVMNRHIPTDMLQKAIGEKYLISDAQDFSKSTEPPLTAVDTTVSYYPILLIFSYISGISLLVQYAGGSFNWMEYMGDFMSGFFLLFSFFKLLNLHVFAEGYSTYDWVAKKLPVYGYVYPFVELLLGIAYLTNFSPIITNVATLIIMGVSSIGVVQSLLKKQTIQCACLGTIIKLPLSKVTLFEDLLMVAMSAIMLLKIKNVI